MKNYCWLLCMVVQCWGSEQKEYNLNKTHSNEDLQEEYPFDFGNPDIGAEIERPCELYDTFCIRTFLASHSRCKKTYGPVPDPLFRAQRTVNFARVDLAVTEVNDRYTGLNNGRVEEFYINRATDNLVIAIFLESVKVTADNNYLKYYRRGQEPVVGEDKSAIDFGNGPSTRRQIMGVRKGRDGPISGVSHTVVIPYMDNLKLENAQIFSFAENALPPYFVGPGLAAPIASDPALAVQFAAFLADPASGVRELFLTEGPFQVATYIQHNLCDFGLKLL